MASKQQPDLVQSCYETLRSSRLRFRPDEKEVWKNAENIHQTDIQSDSESGLTSRAAAGPVPLDQSQPRDPTIRQSEPLGRGPNQWGGSEVRGASVSRPESAAESVAGIVLSRDMETQHHQHQVTPTGYEDFLVRETTPFNGTETEEERQRYFSNGALLNRGGSVSSHNPHLLYNDLDYDETTALDCKRGIPRLPEYDAYGGIAAPFSPTEHSFMATTITYQHIESQGRQRTLPWGGSTGGHLKWDSDREDGEPRKTNKDQTTPSTIIPDSTLANLSVKELNKRIGRTTVQSPVGMGDSTSPQNLGRDDVIALKQRRRTLKNRGYAVQCRLRRQQYKDNLEMQVQSLNERMNEIEHEKNFYKSCYEKCRCRLQPAAMPLNLEMINNNHDFEYKKDDFRRGYDGSLAYRADKLQDGMFRGEFRDGEGKLISGDCHNKM